MLELNAIWWISKVLIGFSLTLMSCTILRRFRSERREQAEAARLLALQPTLFACLTERELPATLLAGLAPQARRDLVLLARRLIDTLSGPSRDQLVALMTQLGHVENLLAALRDGAIPERLAAAAELAWFDRPLVHVALREALRDPFPGVRLAAATALLDLRQDDAAQQIITALTAHPGALPLTLRPIFRSLARSQQALLLRLAEGRATELAVFAIDALAGMPDPGAAAPLAGLARSHPAKDVRAAALRTIGLLGAAGAAPPPEVAAEGRRTALVPAAFATAALQGLLDADWEVRTQAVIAIQRLRLVDGVPQLRALQADPQWWVRFRAGQALQALDHAPADAPRRPGLTGANDAALEDVA